MLHFYSDKEISLIVNGEETIVRTKQWTLDRLLDEQSITLGAYDKISAPIDTKLSDGDKIVIDHAKEVKVTADGRTNTVYTTGKTVGNVIMESGIQLRKEDKVYPSLDAEVKNHEEIRVVRVDRRYYEEKIVEPHEVVEKKDPKLLEGKQLLVQKGQDGVVVSKIEKVYEDGKLVSKRTVEQLVQQKKIDKIVALGTKKPEPKVTVLSASAKSPAPQTVSKDGLDFTAKKVLKNVTLTAYSAGEESTGKKKGDPGYGKTASGTTVQQGRTIAVDPDVIPLGWWVYIDGIGLRRAEDTGGAIKGNKIDVYYDSEAYVKRFGVKRGYTVYVIGPEKPKTK
jgi:uncharacterized protein YabE (DUF348 family)/3D (Asp-Asp-Asp) domain-containing protein